MTHLPAFGFAERTDAEEAERIAEMTRHLGIETHRCVTCTVPIWPASAARTSAFDKWVDRDGMPCSEAPAFHDHEPRARIS